MKHLMQIFLVSMILGGCAYHAVGTPMESQYASSRECVHFFTSDNPADDGLGVLLAPQQGGSTKYVKCMKEHGWEGN